jgi:hypothetical protein
MSMQMEPNGAAGPRFRLAAGLTVLDRWASTARHLQKYAAYKALFAVADGSVFRDYLVLGDADRPEELAVLVSGDLLIKIAILGQGNFGIRYIGPNVAMPDLDRGDEAQTSWLGQGSAES